jgi:hypothetical protein
MLNQQIITADQRERIFRHEGFGNPRGRIWFIGKEEAGGSLAELHVRATFRPIEGLRAAQERLHPVGERVNPDVMVSSTDVWTFMSQIALRLDGNLDWAKPAVFRSYRNTRLGELDGDTFLAELLPLPRPGHDAWPYGDMLGIGRSEYARNTIPQRRSVLTGLVATHQPSYVLCYGKGKDNWKDFRATFASVRFDQLNGQNIQLGRLGRSQIVLMPFLGFGQWKIEYVELLAKALLQPNALERLEGVVSPNGI